MTHDDLARRVAEAKEPKPAIPSYDCLNEWLDSRTSKTDYASPINAWTLEFTASSRHGGGTCRENWRWQPRPIDDAYAMVLLREVPNPSLWKDSDGWNCDPDNEKNQHSSKATWATAPEVNEAIALAWLAVFEKNVEGRKP